MADAVTKTSASSIFDYLTRRMKELYRIGLMLPIFDARWEACWQNAVHLFPDSRYEFTLDVSRSCSSLLRSLRTIYEGMRHASFSAFDCLETAIMKPPLALVSPYHCTHPIIAESTCSNSSLHFDIALTHTIVRAYTPAKSHAMQALLISSSTNDHKYSKRGCYCRRKSGALTH